MNVQNPIFQVDMPDPDVIRRGDFYYMVSTTMFFMPGGAILRSKDLVHWEPVSYIFDQLEENDIYELKKGRNAYGKGQWATSLLYHNQRYYACFVCHDLGKTFIYETDDIEKSNWTRHVIPEVFHDMSFLIWDKNVYLVYGNGTIQIVELTEDLHGVKPDGLRQILFETPKEGMLLRCEGCRAYVRNGYIYLTFIDIPSKAVGSGQRRQLCYRSRDLLGPYEGKVIMDDNQGATGRGIAQGVFIQTENDEWYAMLFQDRGSVGRVPHLMPMCWENDWPVLGIQKKVPRQFTCSLKEYPAKEEHPFMKSDSFCHAENKLGLFWQWNHHPIPECWSFTQRPGFLRLKTGQLATSLLDARNTLTQRTMEPGCRFQVTLDVQGLRDGDYAGMCAFQSQYGQIGIRRKEGMNYLFYYKRKQADGTVEMCEFPYASAQVHLMIVFDFREFKDSASFFYSADGDAWKSIGEPLQMVYTLDLFVGYRMGLFYYATEVSGGTADFTNLIAERV